MIYTKMFWKLIYSFAAFSLMLNMWSNFIVLANPWYNDNTPPAAISNLSAVEGNPSSTKINLHWTAVGDDWNVWTAASYIIKYSTSMINSSNFNTATNLNNGMSPSPAWNSETYQVWNLTPNTTYYFAIKVVDDAGNFSDISNIASFTTNWLVPTISSISSTSNQNNVFWNITINGNNLINWSIIRFTNSNNTFNLNSTYINDNQIQWIIPIGAPVWVYNIKIVNSNWISVSASQSYTITQWINPQPTVTNLYPNIWSNNEPIAITIKWANFNWVTSVKLDDLANTILSPIQVVDNNTINTTVPAWVNVWSYNIMVTSPNWTNLISSVKLNIQSKVIINSSNTNNVNTTEIVDMWDTNITPVQITMNSDNDYVNQSVDNNIQIQLVIPANTAITDWSWNPYFGNINPPRAVKADTNIYPDIDSSSVVFQMWNPNTKINFNNPVVVNLTIESNNTPIVWYLNKSTNKYELAWTTWTKWWINYQPWGTIISKSWNIYEVWLLITHMSSFVIWVSPKITSSNLSWKLWTSIQIDWNNFHPNATLTVWLNSVPLQYVTNNNFAFIIPNSYSPNQSIIITNPDGRFAVLWSSIEIPRTWWWGWIRTISEDTNNLTIPWKIVDDKKDLPIEYVEQLEEKINDIQKGWNEKSYKINQETIKIITPEFKSNKTSQLVENINVRMISLFKIKNIKLSDLEEAVENYNWLLASLKLYQETKQPWARLLVKDHIEKLTYILDKVQTNWEIEDAIAYINKFWLTKYTTKVDFRYQDWITRQEWAKFFTQLSKNILTYRMKTNRNCNFKDSHLFDPTLKDSIKEVCEYWLMTWTPDGYFLPNKKLTSAEVITILMRAYEWRLDENISPWYANYFLKAREAKITDVGMKMWRLDSIYVNRGQTAVYIYRLWKNINK